MLEVGGGLGVLSEHLAERVAHVHVVELDRSLEPALRDALDPHPNTTLHLADAVRLDLAALDPAPTKVVANLPYGVAATVILRTIAELPAVTHLGRDGAEGGRRALRRARRHARLRRAVACSPSSPATCACCAPSRVRSSIPCRTSTPCSSGLTRRGPAPEPALRALVQQGFAHRRKALARSLASRPAPTPGLRDRARAALEAIGRPADARAEQLAPEEWRALQAELTRHEAAALPRARQGQPLPVRRPPARRRLSPARLARAAGVARRRAGARARARRPRDEVVCPGVEGENLAARALARFRAATGWDGAAGADHDRQARAGRGRDGRRLGRRRRDAAARRRGRRAAIPASPELHDDRGRARRRRAEPARCPSAA